MEFLAMQASGCYEVHFAAHGDARGWLVKITASPVFQEHGLETGFVDTMYSVSSANVLRGMHLQLLPADHAKLAYRMTAAAMDVALDLGQDLPAYRKSAIVELSSERRSAWPTDAPILSVRDAAFSLLNDFVTPFRMHAHAG